jgi:hypothetical protein
MLDYEILIFGEKANPRAFVEMQDGDDDDAIRSATRIANGRPFEVWRDLSCIHRSIEAIAPQRRPISRWRDVGGSRSPTSAT